MQWNAAGIDQIATLVEADNSPYLLGFNEPDNSGQANMTPEDAATRMYRSRYYPDI
jgi:hypothetical protein